MDFRIIPTDPDRFSPNPNHRDLVDELLDPGYWDETNKLPVLVSPCQMYHIYRTMFAFSELAKMCKQSGEETDFGETLWILSDHFCEQLTELEQQQVKVSAMADKGGAE